MQDFAWLERVIYDNTVGEWLLAVGAALLSALALKGAWNLALKRVQTFASQTETDLDDLIAELLDKTKLLFIVLVSLWAGSRLLDLSDTLDAIFRGTLTLGLLLQGGFWGVALIDYVVKVQRQKQLTEDPGMATAIGAMGFIARIALWTLVVLTALANLGVNITTFVASLGIGGLAVALALQNVLGDLFASLSIVLDKPFVLGDYIVTGEVRGTVEHVGLKTTRLRALSGEQLVISNSDLLSSRIQNFKRMNERRALFAVGVTYDTPSSKLRAVPEIIREAVESRDNTRFDRSHFKQFGPSSLDFETVYYMTVPDYATYMETQQAINLDVFERFASEGIEFAFPTQTLHIAPSGGPPGGSPGGSLGSDSTPHSGGSASSS